MEVVSACSLPVGSIVWQSRSGSASLTVVCKATYALCPVESRLADEQDPLHDADRFWNDDPRQALRLASDFAPFKRRADVLLTGHAYAPRGEPSRSIVARLLVGEVDKAIEVFVDRVFTAAGQLREGPRFTRSPLLWQYAAGGPDTVNPVGLRHDAPPDIYGQRALPRLQPPGLHVTGPDDYLPPVGFGPIAPAWRERSARLFHHAATWDHQRWSERPLPDDIDAAYFNAALPDQQVEAIRPNERLVLENLDPEHPRLVTNLATATPRAIVEWPSSHDEDVGFRCDTLWIDTDRRCCSLTWRAAIPLLRGELPTRVTVRLGAARRKDASPDPRAAGSTTIARASRALAALPFMAPSADAAPSTPPAPLTVGGSPLSGSVLGGMRLGTPGVGIAPSPARSLDLSGLPFRARAEAPATSPMDLDADTIDSHDFAIADDDTQDHLEVPHFQGLIMPFAAPSPSPVPALDLVPPPPPWLPSEPGAAPSGPPVTRWSSVVEAREPMIAPALESSAPPAPPPLLGPLATPGMIAAHEPASPAGPASPAPATELTDAPAPAPAPGAAAAALPLDRFPIVACARIAASVARRKPDTSAILAEHELAPDVWSALEKHWSAAVSAESQRGKTALLRAHDEAYVARLEEERGTITPKEYARLMVAVERGRADVVLAELSLPRGAILRIQRVWLNRIAADAAFNKTVRAAMAAESEGEE